MYVIANYYIALLFCISAILYNNLIYLAHNVLTIDFDKRFLSTRLHSSSIPEMSCFTDLILPLRKEANKVLSLQIQRQQKVLFSFLKDSGKILIFKLSDLWKNCRLKMFRIIGLFILLFFKFRSFCSKWIWKIARQCWKIDQRLSHTLKTLKRRLAGCTAGQCLCSSNWCVFIYV